MTLHRLVDNRSDSLAVFAVDELLKGFAFRVRFDREAPRYVQTWRSTMKNELETSIPTPQGDFV